MAEEDGVLGNLPRSRPGRRSEKRSAGRPGRRGGGCGREGRAGGCPRGRDRGRFRTERPGASERRAPTVRWAASARAPPARGSAARSAGLRRRSHHRRGARRGKAGRHRRARGHRGGQGSPAPPAPALTASGSYLSSWLARDEPQQHARAGQTAQRGRACRLSSPTLGALRYCSSLDVPSKVGLPPLSPVPMETLRGLTCSGFGIRTESTPRSKSALTPSGSMPSGMVS